MLFRIVLLASFAALVGAASVSAADKDGKLSDIQLGLLKTFKEEFVAITPGKGKFPKSFQMGSADGPKNEQPAFEVTLGYEFHFAKYEVPQNLYEAVLGNNPSKWTGPRNSVEEFDYDQAVEFCSKATSMLRQARLISSDQEVRLPTEAEWEYCCRAGTKTKYSFGDEAQSKEQIESQEPKKAALLDPYGWHTGNAAGNDPPIGALKPNAWGLYDMHGYLWEFVSDDWHDDYKGAPADGSVRRRGDKNVRRTIRSGSWREAFPQLTSTARRAVANDFHRDDLGLRCVLAKAKD
jgi:formylglycine-generating enzyme required for sulfatase activity